MNILKLLLVISISFCSTSYPMYQSNVDNVAVRQCWGPLTYHIGLIAKGEISKDVRLTQEAVGSMLLISLENNYKFITEKLLASQDAVGYLVPSTQQIQCPIPDGDNSRLTILEWLIKHCSVCVFDWACKHRLVSVLNSILHDQDLFELLNLQDYQFMFCLDNAVYEEHTDIVDVLLSVEIDLTKNQLQNLCTLTKNPEILTKIQSRMNSVKEPVEVCTIL